MIEIQDKRNCCGCSACEQICPRHCIHLVSDKNGFLYPSIDKKKCIDCKLCEKVCPCQNQKESAEPIKTCACKNPNLETRLQSSSGGAFTLIAAHVIGNGGVVFGARFDNQWNVVHDFADSLEGLQLFRGSKYVQSRLSDNFKKCKEFLKQNKQVLFSGTPCQIAGLKNYLGEKYENLITLDTICHAVPSPKIWNKYLDETCSYLSINKNDINKIDFRNKSTGWEKYSFTIDYIKNGNPQQYKNRFVHNPYGKSFLQHLSTRPSCTKCPAKEGRSHSDITLGDFWGIDKIMPEINDDKGIGLLLINSDKGLQLIKQLKMETTDVDFKSAISFNPSWQKSAWLNSDTNSYFFFINHGGSLENAANGSLPYKITRKVIKVINGSNNQ